MATFVNDLRLTELATGEGSGSWGTTTNTNLELIAEAFSFGTEAITTNADTHTTTLADGATDPGRSIFLKYTGTLDSACTITIGPNTISKLWLIENATSGSQNIIIKQGSGATVTIANGQTKAIYSDGAGSGGAMVDAFQDLSIPDLFIDDDLTFTSDSAVITFGADGDTTLTHTDGSGLTLNSTNKIMFNDASQFIQGSSATVLSLGATDEIDLTATAIDVNGTIDVSGNATLGGTLGVTGAVTANAGISIDNITIDGTEIDLSSGDLTIDVAGDIILDADGGDVKFSDAGTVFGSISTTDNTGIIIGSQDVGLRFRQQSAGAAVFPRQPDGSALDATLDLGISNSRFKDFYLSGGLPGTASGELVINDNSVDSDFRVESNGNTHMLFVDAGNNRVQFGKSSGGNTNTAGVEIQATGFVGIAGAGIRPLQINRQTDDGDIIEFRQDGTTVGLIGSDSTDIFIGTGDTGIRFNDAVNGVLPYNTGSGQTDATLDLGFSSVRWRDLYLSGGLPGTASGELVINDNSVDSDFRVESNGNTHMLFVDAGSDHVNIGTSTDYDAVLNVQSTDNGKTLSLVSTDTDANAGPVLALTRQSSSSAADGDILGRIDFEGLNDANQQVAYGRIQTFIRDASDGTEDGTVQINHFIAGSEVNALELDNDEYVFNNGSNDVDFRVESDGNANMIFVDAGNDRVMFAGSAQDSAGSFAFNSGGLIRHVGTSGVAKDNLMFAISGANNGFQVTQDSSNNLTYRFHTVGNVETLKVDAEGVKVNDASSSALDFRVETDTNNSAFLVDASANVCLFGKSTDALTTTGATISAVGTATFAFNLTSENESFILNNNNATGATFKMDFRQNNSSKGSIAVGSSSTAYNTSSDYRLKENVETLKDGLSRLAQLKPVQFTWTTDGALSEGFIAHEVDEVFPDAVTGEKDAVDEEGNIAAQQMDYGRITPLLVKAIQEQQEQIEELKAEIATLKGG